MSPAQNRYELIKNYHLALSLIKGKQQKLHWHDYQLTDVSPARMRLVIEQVKNNYQLKQ